MSYYKVYIEVADHSWTVVRATTPEEAEDDLLVLDGLRMGWSMPEGLWPDQPDPMTAAFALTVPDARDIYGLAEGDPVAIEVTMHPDDTDPTFTFYGRLTDLRAVPRGGKRPGVTLSTVAVDYIPDLAELEDWRYTGVPIGGPFNIEEYLGDAYMTGLWPSRPALGDFPPWPDVLTYGFNVGATVVEPNELKPVREHIDFHLRQLVTLTLAEARLIIAPNIDPVTRRPDTDQPWAFDVVHKVPVASPFVIPKAQVVTNSITWQFQKGNGPTRVEVVGFNNDPDTLVYAEHAGSRHVVEQVEASFNDATYAADHAQEVADFYLPPSDVSRWRVETFRYQLTKHTLEDLEGFYQGLFPRHAMTVAVPEDNRGACYGHPITIPDLPGHLNLLTPTPGEEEEMDINITGRLAGAELTVSGRQVALDLQLRQTA